MGDGACIDTALMSHNLTHSIVSYQAWCSMQYANCGLTWSIPADDRTWPGVHCWRSMHRHCPCVTQSDALNHFLSSVMVNAIRKCLTYLIDPCRWQNLTWCPLVMEHAQTLPLGHTIWRTPLFLIKRDGQCNTLHVNLPDRFLQMTEPDLVSIDDGACIDIAIV